MKKIKLNDLKVNSFVTSLDKADAKTLKGGKDGSYRPYTDTCNTPTEHCRTMMHPICI